MSAKSIAFLVLWAVHPHVLCSEPVRFETAMPPTRADGPAVEDPRKAEARVWPISQCGSGELHPVDTANITLLTRCLSAQNVDGKIQVSVEVVNPTSVRLTKVDIIVGFFPSRSPYQQARASITRTLDRDERATIQTIFSVKNAEVPKTVDIRLNAFPAARRANY